MNRSKFVHSEQVIVCLTMSLTLLTVGTLRAETTSYDLKKTECLAPGPYEQVLVATDFRWFYTQTQMDDKFNEIYTSGKRLGHRARRADDTGTYEVLHDSSAGLRTVPLTHNFIRNVTRIIEKALVLGYFDYVFFPDMGHSHLWVPQILSDMFPSPMPADEISRFYTLALSHPETQFLFHTAEQLKMLDEQHQVLSDKQLGWRYFTRNLVARNDGSDTLDVYRNLDHIGNTVCEPANGYALWSAGFYLSASEQGCFAYQHENQTRYFDISLSHLPTPTEQLGPLVTLDGEKDSSWSSFHWGEYGCNP